MESVAIRAYAKINLTLFITGVQDGYHILDSLVASTDLYDEIELRARGDRLINITMYGEGSEGIPYEGNNAVKAAKLFIEKFKTNGADIVIRKNIPMGAGLGGSSADAAGVLKGLAQLYNIDDEEGLNALADKTGSDTRYMLYGGWARLSGRGNIVKPVDSDFKAHILLLVPEGTISTAQCYSAFDSLGNVGGNSDIVERAVIERDIKGLAVGLSNSLIPAAASLSGEIERCIEELKELNPMAINMTGSGSGVYALFENKQTCALAKSRYNGRARAYISEVK